MAGVPTDTDRPLATNDVDMDMQSCVSCGYKVKELHCLPCSDSMNVSKKKECRDKLSCIQCKEVFDFPNEGLK